MSVRFALCYSLGGAETAGTGLCIYLSLMTSAEPPRGGRRLHRAVFPLGDAREYQSRHSKEIVLFAVSVVSVWRETSDETHFGKIIALVNIGGLPVLHFIMGRTGVGELRRGSRPFHQVEIYKGTGEAEEKPYPR